MPNLDGISATPQIRERVPETGILILTLHESLDLARMAAKAGAWGFVTKSLASTDLVPTIEAFQASMLYPQGRDDLSPGKGSLLTTRSSIRRGQV